MTKKKQNKEEKKIKKIEEKIIKVGIELAKSKEGALFVILTGKTPKHSLLVEQNVRSFSILGAENDKLLKSLAIIDGAIFVSKAGKLLSYGVMINNVKALRGFGTRHAAALTASREKNISILVSEEEQKIKLFKNGRYIMQLDALEKRIEEKIPAIATLFEIVGAGLIGTIGVAVLAPVLGITLIPGVIIFGSSYYAIKKILEKIGKVKWKNI